jgi:Protein of unknown function (DUF2934)
MAVAWHFGNTKKISDGGEMVKKRTPAKVRMHSTGAAHEQPLNASTNETWHRIATKAYELHEQRGYLDGHDLDDWLKAEAIIKGTTR